MKISDPGNVVRSQLATITFGCQRGQPTSSADGEKVHVSEDPPAFCGWVALLHQAVLTSSRARSSTSGSCYSYLSATREHLIKGANILL